MKLLFSITYYRPNLSGLTLCVQRVAEGLASRGHEVTVVTSRYRTELPAEEELGGVRVVRLPVWFRVSKGAVTPGLLARARPLLAWCDAAVVNLPATPLEAVALPLAARLQPRRPVVAAYYSEVQLPGGTWNAVVSRALAASNGLSCRLAHTVVAHTEDFARSSRVLRRVPDKLVIIPPPVAIAEPDPRRIEELRRVHAPRGEVLIGVVARLAAEKGIGVLLEALPEVKQRLGRIRVLIAGEGRAVIGEETTRRELQPALVNASDIVRTLGVLPEVELASLYAACDLTVLPSLNSTESFGMVQVESMLCGTPVVASDLPGVRVPVTLAGMGALVPPGDPGALAAAIVDVARRRDELRGRRATIAGHFSLARALDGWEELLRSLLPAAERS